MDRVLWVKLSTPTKTRIVSDTGNKTLYTFKLSWWMHQAFAVAQNFAFIQIHVNRMTHQVIAVHGWRDNCWAWDWFAEFPEGTGN